MKPKIVCLCGSTRLQTEFEEAQRDETLAGRIVLSVGFFTFYSWLLKDEVKQRLDELHLRKIDLCDEVLVINARGYIGESTSKEIQYALSHGKPIRLRYPEFNQDIEKWRQQA